MYLFHIPIPGVVQTLGIQTDPQSLKVNILEEEFSSHLLGFACAICVSDQH